MPFKERVILLTIFLISLVVRTYRLEKEFYIKWDERHFLNYSKFYLLREFYFDVHPPLGKLFLALLGYLFNLDQECKYVPLSDFPENMDFLNMKLIHCFIGALIPLLAYLILKEFFKKEAAFCASVLLIFEHSFVFVSRILIIDIYMLFFVMVVNYFFVLYYKRNSRFSLVWLGLSLGILISIKWSGLFSLFHIGLFFLLDFYQSLKFDLKEGLTKFFKYLFLLLILPLCIYITVFYIHFVILVKPTKELIKMSSFFKNSFYDSKDSEVKFGKEIVLKNTGLNSGLLHMYSTDKTFLIVISEYNGYEKFIFQSFRKVDALENHEFVALFNLHNQKYVCVNEVVTGKRKFDLGCVFLLQTKSRKRNKIIKNKTPFSIYNPKRGCYLQPTTEKFSYDFNMIVCKNKKHFWMIEDNFNNEELNLKEKRKNFKPNFHSFFKLFYELNKRMYFINQSFIPNKELKPLSFTSTPKEWLFFNNKITFNTANKPKFVFTSNMISWYFSSLSILLVPLNFLIKKRKKNFKYYFLFFGWLVNYMPYLFLERVTYFHHYLPALLFSTMSTACIFEKFSFLRFLIFISFFYFLKTCHLVYGY